MAAGHWQVRDWLPTAKRGRAFPVVERAGVGSPRRRSGGRATPTVECAEAGLPASGHPAGERAGSWPEARGAPSSIGGVARKFGR